MAPASRGVSVAVPFYRGDNPEHFCAAVQSILDQTLPPQEVLLVQDGPVGEALATVASGFVASDGRVRLLVIPANRGLPHALNVSILAARCDYYARMDADDISAPTRLEKQVALLEARAEVDVVSSWGIEFQVDPEEDGAFLKRLPTDASDLVRMFHHRNPFIHAAVVFRRSVFARIGLYDPALRLSVETDLWARAFRANVVGANIPEPLYYIRTRGVLERRAGVRYVWQDARSRFKLWTWSPRLNALKIAALLFHLLPRSVMEWGYRSLR